MNIRADAKAVSTLVIIILMIISAILGGIISYAFTIAYYIKTSPAITITDIYINKENVNSFTVSVLNPSYSTMDATISRIAISLKGETKLYDVIETEPSIENGIILPIGESRNVTCLKIKKDNGNFTLGDFIGSFGFAGKTMIVHVFSSDFPATNREVTVPYVKLNITEGFNSKYSFKKFNITLTNDPQSEVNVTISDVLIGVNYSQVEPPIKGCVISKGESVRFNFTGNWHGVEKTNIVVYTEQGYIFRKEIEAKSVHAVIQSVNFDINNIGLFTVTIFNCPESAHYANITMIKCKLDNETYIHDRLCDPPVGITPNSTVTIEYYWNWKEYRGRNITVVVYFLQDFETAPFNATTPSSVIINATCVFDLKDKEHFNITIQNHASSLEAINVTKLVVKEAEVVLNGANVYPPLPNGLIIPGSSKAFNCTFNWADFLKNHGRNLTLTIHVIANVSLEEHAFDFSFVLPVAELNVTVRFETNGIKYLNVTVKNLNYSLWKLTLSKIVVTVNITLNSLRYEYIFPENEMTVNVGGEAVLLFSFDWQKYSNKTLIVTIVTEEQNEISYTWSIP